MKARETSDLGGFRMGNRNYTKRDKSTLKMREADTNSSTIATHEDSKAAEVHDPAPIAEIEPEFTQPTTVNEAAALIEQRTVELAADYFYGHLQWSNGCYGGADIKAELGFNLQGKHAQAPNSWLTTATEDVGAQLSPEARPLWETAVKNRKFVFAKSAVFRKDEVQDLYEAVITELEQRGCLVTRTHNGKRLTVSLVPPVANTGIVAGSPII